MTSTTTRIITITLAALALTAPVAGAMPIRDEGVRTSSLAGTPAPKQDLRNPDQQAPAPAPKQDQRVAPGAPDFPTNTTPLAPPRTERQPVADDGGPSPLVFIAPTLVLVAMLGAAFVYTRSARRPARV